MSLLSAALFAGVQGLRFGMAAPHVIGGLVPVMALCGLVALYVSGWIARGVCQMFGVKVEARHLRIALGLGLVPWTALSFVLFLLLREAEDPAALQSLFPVFFLFFIYGYYVLLMAFAGVTKLGVLRSFFALSLTAIVAFFPITLLAQGVFSAFGLTP